MKPGIHRLSFSVAVRGLDLARLGASLIELSGAGIAEVNLDVADGAFVPEFGLGFDVIEAVRRASELPRHVHLMTERPERFVEAILRLGCQTLTVPIEACLHAHRTITRVRELGMAPGVSIQPGSPLTKLEYVLPIVDHVVLPLREAGGRDEAIAAAAFDRVRILRENLDYHESKAVLHVQGELDAADAARLAALGATRIVIDRRDVLRIEPLGESLRRYMEKVTRAKRTA